MSNRDHLVNVAHAAQEGDIDRLRMALIGESVGARFAAKKLQKLGATEAIPEIEELLDSQDPSTRAVAIRVLGRFGETSETKKLRDLATEDSVPFVRAAALGVYAKFVGAEAEPDLVVGLRDPDWGVRNQAVRHLGRVGSERAVAELVTAAKLESRIPRPMPGRGDPAENRARGPLTRRIYRKAIRQIRRRSASNGHDLTPW